jgi:hypothetical protein
MKVVMNVLSVVTEFLLSETKNLPHQEIVVTKKKKEPKKKEDKLSNVFPFELRNVLSQMKT